MKTVRNRCEDGSIWRGIGRRSGALLPWCDWLNTLNLEDSFAKKLALGVSMIVFLAFCPAEAFWFHWRCRFPGEAIVQGAAAQRFRRPDAQVILCDDAGSSDRR
jgi:hypothetical protein